MGKLSALIISENSTWGKVALAHAKAAGFNTEYFAWSHGEAPVAKGLSGWQGDWILSFKADYILSPNELRQARLGAINFHPAPPNLRGVGTYQAALAQKRTQYGVTCHHMTEQVDAGSIIATRFFDITPEMTPLMLQEFAAAHLYMLYVEIIHLIQIGTTLPESAERWSGPLLTWKQLEKNPTEKAIS